MPRSWGENELIVCEGREEVTSEGTDMGGEVTSEGMDMGEEVTSAGGGGHTGEEVISEGTRERKEVVTRARAHRTLKSVEWSLAFVCSVCWSMHLASTNHFYTAGSVLRVRLSGEAPRRGSVHVSICPA